MRSLSTIPVQDRAISLSEKVFTGGPVEGFEKDGRHQLVTLLKYGLNPWSRVLDVGCGCLRGGYWLIHFLNRNCYFGIEPNRAMLEAGLHHLLETEVAEAKQPHFDHNAVFDFTVFGERFDFIIARSIWTHASKHQIEVMLEEFCHTAAEGATFFTSYLPAHRQSNSRFALAVADVSSRISSCLPSHWFSRPDYQGETWIGRSHNSDIPGVVYHSLKWVREVCFSRKLQVTELGVEDYNGQIWLRITRDKS